MNLGVWFRAAECERPPNNIDPPVKSENYLYLDSFSVFQRTNKKIRRESQALALNA